ncbi:trypsin-7-like [Condylostylus longicornis]|uniref:trypsin-7-like n=1 Tax=Condylostylus longicornis TaxID=2530218 RepID=UPI00244DD38B|nr:trypsin-7-like [Condylostylus longicornis]
MLHVAGWGKTSCICDNLSILKSVMVPKVSERKCRKIFKSRIDDSMFCAGYVDGGPDSCEGDSGGPALYKNKVVGIVSWGNECGQPNNYGVYSKVSHVINWIKEITEL